jgi:hypothetical protein
MLQDEALFNLFYNSIQVVVGELLENNLFGKNGGLKKGALEKLLKKMIIDEK